MSFKAFINEKWDVHSKQYAAYKKAIYDKFHVSIDVYQDQIHGGLGDHANILDFPLAQILMGMEVEKEHTDDPLIALEISLDHLTEDQSYYTKLAEMEKK